MEGRGIGDYGSEGDHGWGTMDGRLRILQTPSSCSRLNRVKRMIRVTEYFVGNSQLVVDQHK